ncbi:DUF1329 domain-containing protein [Ideonella sp. B508-1]|uniref:DUF1329 domain-containing protein n=1 Tax=Ideonella sp. B508-1 TaxID=137716 RepID=UPI00034CBC8E|nr:DUF1329 domain-containing protein [Ideonella sp. B508-1]
MNRQAKWVGTPLVAGILAAATSLSCVAASPDDVARLGKDLTPWGAEVAGNKDGSIPAWSGGQKALPAGFNPNGGGKRWVDPFAGEKPLFTITAENAAKYQDKLLGSTQELFRRYPKDFRMEVYPSHRTVWVPDWVNANTAKNAASAKILPNGYALGGAFGGIPFPFPKTGLEVWWNNEVRYKGTYHRNNVGTWTVDSAGRRSLNGAFISDLYFPNFDQEVGREKFLAGDGLYYKVYNDYTAPASRVGEVNLYWTWYDQSAHAGKGWIYTPGTRRVRTTPDLFYDTPCPGYNGGITMDDIQMTYGPQDRFDWKLVGKQEKLIPYNNYTQQFATTSAHILTPNFPNPEDMRWELHRVWVIEGTPKAGVHHIYSKKVVYIDEDYGSSEMETYDKAGKIFRAGWSTMVELYDIGVPYSFGNFFFDFSTGMYWLGSHPGDASVKGLEFPKDDSWRKSRLPMLTPEYLQANGIR